MYFLEELIDTDLDLPGGFVFDIETTGLSPKAHRIAMISYAYQEEDRWVLRQEMAEEAEEEALLLLNFIKLSQRFLFAVHYNGQSFDLPFINTRLENLSLAHPFDKRRGFDLYLHLKRKKKGNLRLVAQEKNAGFYRKDRLSGKDWVELYTLFRKQRQQQQREALFLHNKEDVLGTMALLRQQTDFQEDIHYRLYKDYLILDGFPGKDELRLLLFGQEVRTLDLPALSYDLLLFSPSYTDAMSVEEKRKALLAYDKKCFYENIKRELEKYDDLLFL